MHLSKDLNLKYIACNGICNINSKVYWFYECPLRYLITGQRALLCLDYGQRSKFFLQKNKQINKYKFYLFNSFRGSVFVSILTRLLLSNSEISNSLYVVTFILQTILNTACSITAGWEQWPRCRISDQPMIKKKLKKQSTDKSIVK